MGTIIKKNREWDSKSFSHRTIKHEKVCVLEGRRNPLWLRRTVKESQRELQMCLKHASSFIVILSWS